MFMIDTRILKAMIIVDSKGVNLPLRFIDDPKSPFPKIERRIRDIEYDDELKLFLVLFEYTPSIGTIKYVS